MKQQSGEHRFAERERGRARQVERRVGKPVRRGGAEHELGGWKEEKEEKEEGRQGSKRATQRKDEGQATERKENMLVEFKRWQASCSMIDLSCALLGSCIQQEYRYWTAAKQAHRVPGTLNARHRCCVCSAYPSPTARRGCPVAAACAGAGAWRRAP